MSSNSELINVYWEVLGKYLREFFGNVWVILEVYLPRILSGIEIEAGGSTEVPMVAKWLQGFEFAGSIRKDYCQAILRGISSESRFNQCSFVTACQASQEKESRMWNLCSRPEIRNINGEIHFCLVNSGEVRTSLNSTVEVSELFLDFDFVVKLSILGRFRNWNDGSDAVPRVQGFDGLINVFETIYSMSHIWVYADFVCKNFVHELWNFSATFPTSKGSSFPDTSSNQLKGSRLNFLSRSCDSDDARFSNSSMSQLYTISHHLNTTSTVESKIKAPFFLSQQVVLHCLGSQSRWIHALCGTQFFSQLEFIWV